MNRLTNRVLKFAAFAVVCGFAAEAVAGWRYENGAITDGDWVLTTDSVTGGRRITGVQTVGTQGAEIDLQSVADLPADIVAIGNSAFRNKSTITVVKLPSTLTTIGSWAFGGCSSLAHVIPFLPDSLTSIGAAAFCGAPVEDDLTIANADFKTIPNDDNFNGVFQGIRSKVIDLSQSGITSIGVRAFISDTTIERLLLPETLTSIGSWTFGSCSSLTNVIPFLPDSLTSIGRAAFRGAPVEDDLTIANENFTTIPDDDNRDGVFQGNRSKVVDFSKSGLVTVGSYAFAGNAQIETVLLPETLTTIKAYAFNGCTALETIRLPDSLTTIGNWAFGGCSSLAHVVPFLPDSLTSIGRAAFRGAPVEDDLTIANENFTTIPDDDNFNGVFQGIRSKVIDLSQSGITTIGVRAFISCTALERVLLPDALTSIKGYAFNGCTSLTNVVPLLPGALTTLGVHAFVSCPLEGDLVVTNEAFATIPYANDTWVGMFQSSRLTSADFTGSGLSTLGRYVFRYCTSLKSMKLSESLASIDEEVFSGCSSLTDTSFLSYPSTAFKTSVFNGAGSSNLASRILYPKTNEGWKNHMRNDSTFVAWENVSADRQAIYAALFPEGPEPKGYSTFGNRLIWLVPVSDGAGIVHLSVVAEPEEVGAVEPAYGMYENVGERLPILCTNSLFGATPTIGYSNVCCRVEVMGEDWWEPVETLPDTLSYSFEQTEDGMYRVVWQWQPVGYALNVPESALGGVSQEGQTVAGLSSLGTYYVSNTVVTLTATSFSGAFLRWYGDVPAGHETDNPLEITMERAKTVSPYFDSTEWTYDGATKTISDGNWTLSVSGSSDSLAVTGVNAVDPTVAYLDLSKPIVGATLTSISGSAFRNRTQLETVKLPSTLTTIGSWAFGGCSSLAHVIPFLPDSLTSIGAAAFCGAPVEDDLTIANADFKTIPNDDNFNGVFQGIRSKVIDLSQSGITSIGVRAFISDTTIERLLLPETLTSIGSWTFGSCSSLTNVIPFLPDSLTSIGRAAFRGAPVEDDLTIANENFTTIPDDDNFNGVFQGIRSKVIDLSQSGITTIGVRAFISCTALERVLLPDALTSIKGYAFNGCTSLTNVVPLLPGALTTLGVHAFVSCPLEGDLVVTNEAFATIPYANDTWVGMFQSSRLTSADFTGSGLSTLGRYVFRYCTSLKSVKFSAALSSVGDGVFTGCTGLRDVYWHHSTSLTLANDAFSGISALNFRHFVPRGDVFWASYLAEKCTVVTPLTDEEKAAYAEEFPGARMAKGKAKIPSTANYQYYLTWNPDPNGMKLIFR